MTDLKPKAAKKAPKAEETRGVDNPAAETGSKPDKTGSKHAETLFKPGQSGNPNGRPKGARNKLGEAFLSDMLADWEQHGVQVIATVRAEKPDVYLKTVASILPQQLNVKVSDLDDLDDTELDRRIAALARALELEIGTGTAAVREGQAAPGKPLN